MSATICHMETEGGEYLALSCVEITSIPMKGILEADYPDKWDIEDEYRKAFGNLLTEIHTSYRTMKSSGIVTDLSCELVWITEAVQNQTYKAKIRLFLLIRTIADDLQNAENALRRVQNSCLSMMHLHKYGIDENCNEEVIRRVYGRINRTSAKCIVKAESNELFQNQIMPSCYSFDLLDAYARDMSGFIGSLVEHPDCLLSIQVLPTGYTPMEESAVLQISQSLDTLDQGIMTPGMGNLTYHATERLAEVYRHYQANRNGSLFSYNIMIVGDADAVDDLSTKLKGYMSYDSTKRVRLTDVVVQEQSELLENLYAYPWILNDRLKKTGRDMAAFGTVGMYQAMYRIAYIASVEELSGLFSLPIGNQRIYAGLPINDSEGMNRNYGDDLINSGDISVGTMKSGGGRNTIGISLQDLTKHMLIAGTPGSGKTTFSVSLLDRLWKEHHIPFLVIEPAKNEYRALVQSIPDLQVFTPGKNYISPFVFNPFVPPKNVRLEAYKSTLKTAFAAGVSMSTPLDKIFEESVNNCYSDFRWLDTYTVDDKGKIFNISDFINCFQKTFEDIGYTGDARNIGRAGVVRLKSLINLFDNYYSIPIQDLLTKPTIIELAAIENSDEKALIISLVLLSILAYVNANYVGDGMLKNVILLEEAHVLLDADSNAGVGDANPARIAQSLVKRMLAEIRSYGVGVMIADQSPRKVTADVVALTDMKMVFRIVESTDKQMIADSTNMTDVQVQRLSRLKSGEAFLFFNRLEEPEEVKTPDYRLENNISISLSDDNIRKLSTYWNDKGGKLRPYPECEMTRYCTCSCDYGRRILAKEIARRIFVKYFKTDMTDFKRVEEVLARITRLVKAELNDEPFSPELLICVKVHLFRKIKYETKIQIRDIQIKNSIEK